MPAMNTELLAWIDTETTGLDPHTGSLLEIAIIITDSQLNIVGTPYQQVIEPAPGWEHDLDLVTTAMHSDNGLLEEIHHGAGLPLDAVDEECETYLSRFAAPGTLLLAGNSITFDREWLKLHLPRTYATLHYRSVDMTSVWQFLGRHAPSLDVDPNQKRATVTNHRALDDLLDSIEEARAFQELLS